MILGSFVIFPRHSLERIFMVTATALGETKRIVFKVGDKAVYPAQGVTEVCGIENQEIAGNKHLVYVLRVIGTNRKIMVPVSKVESVGLREVINDNEVELVYGVLRKRPRRNTHQTWNRRYRQYVEKIKTGSVLDVAEVMRDLYRLKYDKPLSFGERKMLDMARHLLVKELSVAKNSDEDQVEEELHEILTEDMPKRKLDSVHGGLEDEEI
jgi:CarD family transcriptional regulator